MATIYWLICTNCNWQGEEDELVTSTDNVNDRNFSFCPFCSGNDFDEDKEEIED